MLSNLLAVIVVGGLPVIWTYFIASQENYDVRQYIYVPDFMYWGWIVSMILTVVSYVTLAYTFVWGIEDGTVLSTSPEKIEPFLCATYALFLASAGQWVHHVIYDIQNRKKSIWLMINLYGTAAFSIAIGIFAFGIHGIDHTLMVMAKIAGGYIIFHHLAVDAILWYSNWNIEEL